MWSRRFNSKTINSWYFYLLQIWTKVMIDWKYWREQLMNLIVLHHIYQIPYKYIFFFFIGEACWWTVHPASKQRSEGEKVRVGDDLILVSVATERYLVSNFFVQKLHYMMLCKHIVNTEVALASLLLKTRLGSCKLKGSQIFCRYFIHVCKCVRHSTSSYKKEFFKKSFY